jgi:hypothetical protein
LLIWHSSSFHPSAAVLFSQIKASVFNSSQLSNWIALLLWHSSSFHQVAAMFFFSDGILLHRKSLQFWDSIALLTYQVCM